ncbi:MAG: hypothetical protein NVS2B17_06040 [Candidatus Velthaea sp.]
MISSARVDGIDETLLGRRIAAGRRPTPQQSGSLRGPCDGDRGLPDNVRAFFQEGRTVKQREATCRSRSTSAEGSVTVTARVRPVSLYRRKDLTPVGLTW